MNISREEMDDTASPYYDGGYTSNAIDRLREQILATSMDGLTGEQQALVAAFHEFVQDGSDVDALYQAAKGIFRDELNIATMADLAGREPSYLADPFYALAAAVRRVEGEA